MVVKKIYNDVYEMVFMFIIAKTRDEVYKKYAIDWNEWGGCCLFHGRIWIIIHPRVKSDVLVHECDHAVSKLWKDRGIKKIQDIDEAYSYMVSWLYKKCKKARRQYKKRKK